MSHGEERRGKKQKAGLGERGGGEPFVVVVVVVMHPHWINLIYIFHPLIIISRGTIPKLYKYHINRY